MSDIWFVCKKTDKVLELGDCLKCEEPKNCLSRACYEQGRADEKRENEQDAYHRGYIDGQAKCSFDNELKIRTEERERIVAILKENSYEVDIDCPPYQETVVSLTDILEVLVESEIVRGGE